MSLNDPIYDRPLSFDNVYDLFVPHIDDLRAAVIAWYREAKGGEPSEGDIQFGIFRSFEAKQFDSRWGTMRSALQNAWPLDAPAPTPNHPSAPGPVDESALRIMPRYGMSIGALVVCSKANIAETVKRFVDAGVNYTRVNLTSALWTAPTPVDVLPFRQRPDGVWDLDDWDSQHDDRVAETRDRMNGAGIRIAWTLWEDYSYSNRRGFRKPGVRDLGIPDGNLHPYRNNVQGFKWGGKYNGDIHEDDETLGAGAFDGSPLAIPNAWAKRYMLRQLPMLGLLYNILEIGNEHPEKNFHRRVKEFARLVVPGCLLQVNRASDSPGQYPNMKITRDYDFIAFHGNRLKQLSDLDRPWDNEPVYQTMRELLDDPQTDLSRITFSSDGARVSSDPFNPYDWNTLGPFIDELARRKVSYDHQSRAKLSGFPNHDMIEVEWFQKRRKA